MTMSHDVLQMLTSRLPVPGGGTGLSDRHGWEYKDPNRLTPSRPAALPLTQGAGVSGGSAPFSPASSCSSNPSVAASFFARWVLYPRVDSVGVHFSGSQDYIVIGLWGVTW